MSLFTNSRRLVFAVDLDGTLCDFLSEIDYYKSSPIISCVSKLNRLYADGHKIIIHTSRLETDREPTEKWLKHNCISYNELIMEKPTADYYVDSRALNLDSFVETKFEAASSFSVVSWEEFVQDISILCDKIDPSAIDRIAGIPRKGLIPAVLLALKLRKEVIDYKEVREHDLLVDDLTLTGATAKHFDKSVKFASVYVSNEFANYVDYYARIINFTELDKKRIYMVFPWDYHLMQKTVLDTNKDLDEQMGKELYGKPKERGIVSRFGKGYEEE